jgi:hypothetical protein
LLLDEAPGELTLPGEATSSAEAEARGRSDMAVGTRRRSALGYAQAPEQARRPGRARKEGAAEGLV